MATNKFNVDSLAAKMRGVDNWLNPVPTIAELPTNAVEGDMVNVYADPTPGVSGIYMRRNGQWEFAPAGSGGGVEPYLRVLAAGNVNALAEAVESLPSTGGTIFLQEGTHTLTRSAVIAQNNVRITGVGPASRIVVTSTAPTPFLSVAGTATFVEISDLTIEVAQTATATVPTIAVGSGTSHVRVRNLTVVGYSKRTFQCAGSQVMIDACTVRAFGNLSDFTFATLLAGAAHVVLRHNTVIDYPTFLKGHADARTLHLTDNRWLAPAVNLEPPRFCLGQGTTDLVIDSNDLVTTDTGTFGEPLIELVDGTGTGQVLITNNRIRAAKGFAIAVTDSTVQIRGNHFRVSAQAGTVVSTGGFSFESNQVDASPGVGGLLVMDCPYGDVANNVFRTEGQTAVVLESGRGMISGNRILNGVAASPAPALHIKPGAQGNAVVNTISNRPVLNEGTDTIQANNTVIG